MLSSSEMVMAPDGTMATLETFIKKNSGSQPTVLGSWIKKAVSGVSINTKTDIPTEVIGMFGDDCVDVCIVIKGTINNIDNYSVINIPADFIKLADGYFSFSFGIGARGEWTMPIFFQISETEQGKKQFEIVRPNTTAPDSYDVTFYIR